MKRTPGDEVEAAVFPQEQEGDAAPERSDAQQQVLRLRARARGGWEEGEGAPGCEGGAVA